MPNFNESRVAKGKKGTKVRWQRRASGEIVSKTVLAESRESNSD